MLALEVLCFLSTLGLSHLKVTLGLGVAKHTTSVYQLLMLLVIVGCPILQTEDQVVLAWIHTHNSTPLWMINKGLWQFFDT